MPTHRARLAISLITLSLASLSSCSAIRVNRRANQIEAIASTDETIQIQQTDRVMIRAANESDFEMKGVIIRFPSQAEEYGTLEPHTQTDYRAVSKSYGYAMVETSIDGNQALVMPSDYVGESLIPNGNYTYSLSYDPALSNGHNKFNGQLKYQQTAIDEAIDKALDNEIAEVAFKEYYYGKGEDGLLHCVHQQTHRQENEADASVIVYANVICAKPYSGEESYKAIETIPRVPLRLELKKTGNSFSVVDYQSHNKLLGQRDFRKFFPPQLIDEIGDASIRQDTYNKLQLKIGR